MNTSGDGAPHTPAASAVLPPIEPPRPKPAPPDRAGGAAFSPLGATAAAFALIAGAVGTAAFGLGEVWTADPIGEETTWALRATPWNPVAWRRAALDSAYAQGDAAAATDALRRAAALSPLAGAPRSELAAHLEADGDLPAAETELLAAAQRDGGFGPRWELANFYLRHGDEDAFWRWIREALTVYPAGAPAAMGLCWRAFDDAALIQERAVPDDIRVTRRYFDYLADTERLDALRLLWDRFAPRLQQQDLPAAARFIDLLIKEGSLEQALEKWNELCRRELVAHQPLSPERGPYLTNGLFRARISNLGFDWRLDRAAGVRRFQRQVENGDVGFEIQLSGNQDERAVLLYQVLALAGGRDFTLDFQYATQRLPRDTGIGWALRDHRSGMLLAEGESLIGAEDFWDESRFTFHAPEELNALRLELQYRLREGSSRQRGRFVLRRLDLRPAREGEIPTTPSSEAAPAAEL